MVKLLDTQSVTTDSRFDSRLMLNLFNTSPGILLCIFCVLVSVSSSSLVRRSTSRVARPSLFRNLAWMAITTTIELNFDKKLETVTAGLTKEHSNLLEKIPREDALTVMDYMISLNAEVNPSVNYRKDIIKCLTKFIAFCRNSFYSKERTNLNQLDRKDVLAFLDSLRKSEISDPLHA
jgi:hypothetical protein